MAGIYIHIPFCKSRCIYCGFCSTTHTYLRQAYVEALCHEMVLRRSYLQGEPVDTVYLGGGTPSLLTPTQLRRLFNALSETFAIESADFRNMEITLECNPDDLTADRVQQLVVATPVNRVSMGVQTFNDHQLTFMRRRHNAAQSIQAVDTLRSVGINNISIDLMYGLPGETLETWQVDVRQALRLGVSHISAYGLTYEDGTPLARMLRHGQVRETDEETSLAMYNLLVDELSSHGYCHYEISNFALPGRASRHNRGYWLGTPYLGLGASAHSYNRTSRQWNTADIRAYITSIRLGHVPMEREELDAATRYNDMVMTRLRTREGIDLAPLDAATRHYLLTVARRYLDARTLALDGRHLHLTRRGLFVSDYIMSDLMKVP